MEQHELRPRAWLAVLVGLLVVLSPTVRADAATANTTSRAGVIVDEGNGTVKRVGITFNGTISGIAALQLAGFAPTVRTFGGVGGAICALDIGGTRYGCPADGTCLTCSAPDYWAYSRATNGKTSFTFWPAGAGATQVHDGDIEGWRWGTGATPTYVPLNQFFPPTTTTTVAAPPTTAPRVTTPGTTGPTGPGVVSQGTVAPGAATTTTTAGSRPKPGPNNSTASTTTAKATKGASRRGGNTGTTRSAGTSSSRDGPTVDGRRVAAAPPIVHAGSGTSPAVWIVFAAIIAAFAAAIAFAHHRRARVTTD